MRLGLALALILAAGAASAQPYPIPVTVGTSITQIAGTNPLRKRIVFVNPNATAKIAVCPAGSVRSPTPPSAPATLTCAVNGAGSVTILPYGSFTVDNPVPGTGSSVGGPWNAIADTPSSAVTVIEFE